MEEVNKGVLLLNLNNRFKISLKLRTVVYLNKDVP